MATLRHLIAALRCRAVHGRRCPHLPGDARPARW